MKHKLSFREVIELIAVIIFIILWSVSLFITVIVFIWLCGLSLF